MKIAVGMSGGVDSSAAALKLLQSGEQVVGITLILTGLAAEEQSVNDAKYVCDQLGIEHHVFDLKKQFSEDVKDYFASEYASGRTPNPCIRCNRHIKFGYMLDMASDMGCDYVATGHYADSVNKDGVWYIARSESRKDQSYMLWQLTQQQIRRTIFPLKDVEKQDMRSLLARNGIKIHDKPDSQDICFIPDGDYTGFLEREYGFKSEEGLFINNSGKISGKHRGYYHYTIGQRKGLGGGFPYPVFVTGIDSAGNIVKIGPIKELYTQECECVNINMPSEIAVGESINVDVKIRYAAPAAKAVLTRSGTDSIHIVFDYPQKSITPGQSAVAYSDNLIVCGGEIR